MSKLIEKYILKAHFKNRRKRTFSWAKKGGQVKIFFHFDNLNDFVRLEKALLREGITVQGLMVADNRLNSSDYLTIYTCKGFLSQLFNRDKLVEEMFEGGVLLNLYKGSHYLVDYLVAQDSATFKIGVDTLREDLYDFTFQTEEGAEFLLGVADMIDCLNKLNIQPLTHEKEEEGTKADMETTEKEN